MSLPNISADNSFPALIAILPSVDTSSGISVWSIPHR